MEQSDHNKDNKLDFDGIEISFEFQVFKSIVAVEILIIFSEWVEMLKDLDL